MRRFLLVAFTAIGFFTTGNAPGSMDLSVPEIGPAPVTTTAMIP